MRKTVNLLPTSKNFSQVALIMTDKVLDKLNILNASEALFKLKGVLPFNDNKNVNTGLYELEIIDNQLYLLVY